MLWMPLSTEKVRISPPIKLGLGSCFFANATYLLVKYPKLTYSLHKGFNTGIQPIYSTFTPNNSPTLYLHPEAYQEMVSNEFTKSQYIGPSTCQEVEQLIGPFQSSPLSWAPKPGKPGKYRTVHNFSYPHMPTATTASINSSIDADMFPCTWGTFTTICFTIYNLPPRSQAAICDVAEAYHTIPIAPDQWLGFFGPLGLHHPPLVPLQLVC